jgi:O-antigen/teichoic acid export membrane protein
MAFLYAQIMGTLFISITIYLFANKKFPFIKEASKPLPKAEKKKIWSNISILFLNKIGGTVILGADFIIISAFVGISELGIYSNYALIVSTTAAFVLLFITGSEASIGNAIATLNKNELYDVFERISFFIFCISGISAVCLLNLLNPFIVFWIGEAYLLPYSIVAVISINFFFSTNRHLMLIFKLNAGVFRPDMYKPLIEAAFNLSLSIFLAHYYGILGIVAATMANMFLVCVGPEAYITHKHLFKCSVWIYAKSYLIQVSALLIAFAASFYINSFVDNFIIKCFVAVSVSVSVYFLFFFRSREFAYFVGMAKGMTRKQKL